MLVSPKCDDFIKRMFHNETVRRYFISDVLDIRQEDIRTVRLKNTFLWRRYQRQKQGIVDVLVEMEIRFQICWRSMFWNLRRN